MFTLVGFLAAFFQVDDDEDEPGPARKTSSSLSWRVTALR